jgi:phospho-N-acetylmuramoyl-pentapeptide-transferase
VVQVLLAGILAMVISIVAGPKFIEFLRRNEFGQQIREEGPREHMAKQGTPTMGGLLIMASMAVPFLIFSDRTLKALTVFFVTLACAAIGFADDWTKLTHRRSLGLRGRWKLLLLVLVTLFVGVVAHDQGLTTDVYVPLVDVYVTISYGWYALPTV